MYGNISIYKYSFKDVTDEKHIGNELDLIVDYEKNEYEKFRLGLSQFQHGDYFNDSLDNSSFVFLQYLFKM